VTVRLGRGLGVGCGLLIVLSCGGRSSDSVDKIDTPPMDSAIVEACTRLLSCSADITHRSVSECVLTNVGPLRNPDPGRIVTGVALGDTRSASLACINGAGTNCATIQHCASGNGGDCSGIPKDSAICDGTKRVTCNKDLRHELDCPTKDCELDTFSCQTQPPAPRCIVTASGDAQCGFDTCTEATYAGSCDGDILKFCLYGVVKQMNCASPPGAPPKKCGDDGSGAACVDATLPPCGPDAPQHCDGGDIVACDKGRELRESCSGYPLPMSCGNSPCPGSGGNCVTCLLSPQVRCDATHADSCRGASVVYCDGEERSLDCQALGFSGCAATDHGAACR
jgi:hypothetical protein